MSPRFPLLLFGVSAIAICTSSYALAIEYVLSPNPNPKSNTIEILSGDIGIHSDETFENFGAITVHDGGTLRNLAEMDILFDEDGGGGGLSTIAVESGGLLENSSSSKINFDSVSHFNVSGTVNNAGDISADWSVQLAVGSQFNNSGILTNKKGATLRGTFINTGSVVNFTPHNDTGGFFQQIGQFTNEVGGSLINQGEFKNFTTITNRGVITNTTNGGGGIRRGIFRNMVLLNNEPTGEITNRHRWFNTGTLNNAGIFTNHAIGPGMANQSGGSIRNLAGGVFYNNRSLANNGATILNEGEFFVNAIVVGTGTYTQTAGQTVVSNRLAASTIDIQAGLLTGGGTLEGPVTIGPTATVSPGNSPGMLTVEGSYTQQANSALAIEIGGLVSGTEFDVLDIVGSASLDGTLDVSLFDLGGDLFEPLAGNTFDVLTATDGITGEFSSHDLPDLSGGLMWDVNYGADVVTLNVLSSARTADFDNDGDVDADDLSDWKSSFGSGADADGAGFLAWQRQFTGPGQSSATIAVPEPKGVLLLGLGILFPVFSRFMERVQ